MRDVGDTCTRVLRALSVRVCARGCGHTLLFPHKGIGAQSVPSSGAVAAPSPKGISLADGSHIHTPRHADHLAFDHLCQGGVYRGSRIICAARQTDPPPGSPWTNWNCKRRKTLPEVTAVCRVRNLLLWTSRDRRQFTSTVHGSWFIKSGKEPRSQHEHAKTNGEVEPFHLRCALHTHEVATMCETNCRLEHTSLRRRTGLPNLATTYREQKRNYIHHRSWTRQAGSSTARCGTKHNYARHRYPRLNT